MRKVGASKLKENRVEFVNVTSVNKDLKLKTVLTVFSFRLGKYF